MDREEHEEIQQETSPPAGGDVSPEATNGDVEKRLDLALRDAELLKEQLLRKAAEFENYKRRMEVEFRSIIENATERLITELLPVLDDFDRLLKSTTQEAGTDVLRQGFELIANKLNKILMLRGLRPFESTGKPFDVDYHDALLQVPRSDVAPNTVVDEVSRGFMLNDKIIRHAKVVVSAPPGNDAVPGTNTPTTADSDPNEVV